MLGLSGKCTSCENDVSQSDAITCFSCKSVYHAVCPSAPTKQDYACTPSFLKSWNSNSTKENFKWYCNGCLTNLESATCTSMETQFLNLVQQVKALTAEVRDLKQSVQGTSQNEEQVTFPPVSYGGAWSNQNNVQNLRASLVIKPVTKENVANTTAINMESIRKLVVDNSIPVSKIGVSKSGNTFIHCPSTAARDKLQPLLENDLPNKTVISLKEKLPSVSIVGVTEDISKEDLVTEICNQNSYIGDLIKDGHTMQILFMKPPSEGYSNYQVVARVSPIIRDAISAHRNKIYIGLESCKVYDRFYVKRCNKCNCFGHYKAQCQNSSSCGYCASEDHESNGCSLKNSSDHTKFSCINCKKAGLPHEGHSAFWHNCPTYKNEQKKMQSTIPYYDRVKNWN